jgi:hypothetical protein
MKEVTHAGGGEVIMSRNVFSQIPRCHCLILSCICLDTAEDPLLSIISQREMPAARLKRFKSCVRAF